MIEVSRSIVETVRCAYRSRGLTALVVLIAWVTLAFVSCDVLVPDQNRALPFQPAEVMLSPVAGPVRVVILGDFGHGSRGQFDVAKAIAKVHAERPFHFGITVGDNFYERGVSSVSDSKWKKRWEEPYGALGIPFYPSLGNHDYYGNVQAQLDYLSPSKTWTFPARQYRLHSDLVDLIAIDTMDPRPEQYSWLEGQISQSTARWMIVYGHHPIYSAGNHGDTEALKSMLLPLIRGKVALYIAGHDHDLQYFEPVDGTHLIVSGGGGAKLRSMKKDPRALFQRAMYGFTTLEISPERIHVEMYDDHANQVYESDITEAPLRSRYSSDISTEAVAR